MPTQLVLYYTASVTVTVPNKIARKLKEQEGVQGYENATWSFGNKWGDLYYQDEDGEEHMIEGNGGDCDYKRSEKGEWLDEEESGDEEEDENKYTCGEKCECTHCQRNRPTHEEDDMKSHPCECGLKECSDCFPEEDEEDENIPCYSCGADKDTPCDEMTCPFRIEKKSK